MKCGHRLTATLVLLLVSSTATRAQDPEDVRVVNLPKVQSIEGSVEINKPAITTNLAKLSQTVVAPVHPDKTANLELAGVIDARGFRSAVFSIAGQVKSNYPDEGSVGALLIPNSSLFTRAFEEEGEALLSVRVEAAVRPTSDAYFAATRPRFDLAFPSYRVYFFNTTGQPASVALYAYLAN